MKPQEVIESLLGRVASSEDGVAWFSEYEMSQWTAEGVHALQAQKLLKKGHDTKTAVCDGCEEACVLPVKSIQNSAGEIISFLLCTLRSDTNRVTVDTDKLKQWRGSVDRLSDFIAEDLGVHRSSTKQEDDSLYPIGLFHGDKRGQMLLLRLAHPLLLVAGEQSLPLSELVVYKEDGYSVNRTLVAQLVDAATTADKRYTPTQTRREARKLKTQERNERWHKAYRRLKRDNSAQTDTWIAHHIARDQKLSEGKSAETIRKQMKK